MPGSSENIPAELLFPREPRRKGDLPRVSVNEETGWVVQASRHQLLAPFSKPSCFPQTPAALRPPFSCQKKKMRSSPPSAPQWCAIALVRALPCIRFVTPGREGTERVVMLLGSHSQLVSNSWQRHVFICKNGSRLWARWGVSSPSEGSWCWRDDSGAWAACSAV